LTTVQNSNKEKSYELGIYLLLVIFALVFRFLFLGSTTLINSEAVNALQALSLARGENTIIGGNPGYVGLTSLLFAVMDRNEFFARFWTALFGTGLILVPYLYRKVLGREVALGLSVLLVFDACMISMSRTAASSMMGIACFFAAFGFFLNKKPVLASIFGGLFFTSGSEIWIGGLVFALSLLVFRQAFEGERIQFKENWKKLVIPGGIVILAVVSQFLISPNGISGLGSSLADYLKSWKSAPQINLGHFVIEILSLQLPLIFFGVVSIIRGFLQKDKRVAFLATWWGLSLIVVLINPSRNLLQLGWTSIPLIILTVIIITTFIKKLKFDNKWIGLGEFIFAVVMLAMSFFYLMNIINFPEIDPTLYRNKFIALFLPLVLLFAITGLFTWGWNTFSAKNGLLSAILLIGVITMFSEGWKATGWISPIEMQLWKDSQPAEGNRLLQKELSDLGQWTHGQADTLQVEAAGITSPSILWALKDIGQVSYSDQVNPNTVSEVLITPVDLPIQTSASYRGQSISWAETPDVTAMDLKAWIKWMIYRTAPVKSEKIILWVRNDLFK